MDFLIDLLIRDAKHVILGIDSMRAKLDENGFLEVTYTDMKTALEVLVTKTTAQQEAVKTYNKLTIAQNEEVRISKDLLRRVFDSATSAYADKPDKLAPFKVTVRIPDAVKKLSARMTVTSSLAEESKTDLIGNGLTEEDCVNLKSQPNKLDTADVAQQDALKKQKSTTIERNIAADDVKLKLKKFRKFIDARFKKNPEIKALFEPLTEGGGGNNGGDDTPPAPPAA